MSGRRYGLFFFRQCCDALMLCGLGHVQQLMVCQKCLTLRNICHFADAAQFECGWIE